MSNKAGECNSSAELTVVKLNVVKILKGLEDITVDEGQPLKLNCKIEGTPNSVKWYKNGKEVEPDARLQIVNFFALNNILFFFTKLLGIKSR